MTHYFLDTSVALHILYGETQGARQWFDKVTSSKESAILASRLLKTELTRVLRRDHQPVHLRDGILDHVHHIPFSEAVLSEAEAIVPHLKTLDSLHLASLISTGIEAVVVTHDSHMRDVAELIGYHTLDPV